MTVQSHLQPRHISRCGGLVEVDIESLNLGTSSGIVLYEVTKQRREYQSKYRRSRHKGKRAEPLPTIMPREE